MCASRSLEAFLRFTSMRDSSRDGGKNGEGETRKLHADVEAADDDESDAVADDEDRCTMGEDSDEEEDAWEAKDASVGDSGVLDDGRNNDDEEDDDDDGTS